MCFSSLCNLYKRHPLSSEKGNWLCVCVCVCVCKTHTSLCTSLKIILFTSRKYFRKGLFHSVDSSRRKLLLWTLFPFCRRKKCKGEYLNDQHQTILSMHGYRWCLTPDPVSLNHIFFHGYFDVWMPELFGLSLHCTAGNLTGRTVFCLPLAA